MVLAACSAPSAPPPLPASRLKCSLAGLRPENVTDDDLPKASSLCETKLLTQLNKVNSSSGQVAWCLTHPPAPGAGPVGQLGTNAHGEVLEPGRVSDCYLGLLLDPAGDNRGASVLVVAPAALRQPSMPQPDGTVLYELVTGHPDRAPTSWCLWPTWPWSCDPEHPPAAGAHQDRRAGPRHRPREALQARDRVVRARERERGPRQQPLEDPQGLLEAADPHAGGRRTACQLAGTPRAAIPPRSPARSGHPRAGPGLPPPWRPAQDAASRCRAPGCRPAASGWRRRRPPARPSGRAGRRRARARSGRATATWSSRGPPPDELGEQPVAGADPLAEHAEPEGSPAVWRLLVVHASNNTAPARSVSFWGRPG
jgi:hypothetical protein